MYLCSYYSRVAKQHVNDFYILTAFMKYWFCGVAAVMKNANNLRINALLRMYIVEEALPYIMKETRPTSQQSGTHFVAHLTVKAYSALAVAKLAALAT